uniref:NADH-ubiquinone oxidoreductase chain 4L n=1 Tax=Ornithodoros brasiliensis TaxID=888526 RepID=W0FI10_ORNBR|nr:NADH dehydrogenase subunit 4L [Ornithodoros brasiliensis]AHF21687.1 NADH dehydrogenase subunit 4L [Ornithodoros brasiliensis]QZP40890.1 NADH dehydrogenase subunit 4L [Ornithodoros brasiliensis]
MFLIGLLIYVSGFFSVLLDRKHILILLLCLEFMYLGVLFNIFVLESYDGIFVDIIMFMVFVVCEAGMGLSILVMSVYYYGNDKLDSLVLLKC